MTKRKYFADDSDNVTVPNGGVSYIPKIMKTNSGPPRIVQQEVKEDSYKEHVTRRIHYFALLMMKAYRFLQWANLQGANLTFSDIISKTARVQVGTGIKGGFVGNTDAAHLVNTSIVSSTMIIQSLALSKDQKNAIKELEFESGATHNILKADNVGPDKVIDTCMTEYIKELDAHLQTNSLDQKTIIDELITSCSTSLKASKKSNNGNYLLAFLGVQAARQNPPWNADEEAENWAKANGFI